MAVVGGRVHDRRAPWLPVGLVALVAVIAVTAITLFGGLAVRNDGDLTRGSGLAVTEYRKLAPFAAVELAGADDVMVRVGLVRSVAVAGDDKLVDHVTTTVRSGSLIIADHGTFTTEAPMTVAVAVPSLDRVTLSGSGTVTVEGVTSTDFTADLSGTGTLEVSGSADRVTAVLSGLGTVALQGLVAQHASARLEGTGDIRVHATSALDATLTGTGSILYSGSPSVTEHNTGTGSITGA
jgi:Putative auto-transporter adhesin, head GIN domain